MPAELVMVHEYPVNEIMEFERLQHLLLLHRLNQMATQRPPPTMIEVVSTFVVVVVDFDDYVNGPAVVRRVYDFVIDSQFSVLNRILLDPWINYPVGHRFFGALVMKLLASSVHLEMRALSMLVRPMGVLIVAVAAAVVVGRLR